MATKHEQIVKQVQIDWTRENRGRLWPNRTGKAWRGNVVEFENYYAGTQVLKLKNPVLLKYGLCNGSSDLIGFEFDDFVVCQAPIFCSIEVKTKNDKLKPDQKDWLSMVNKFNGRAYVAHETDDGYKLERWTE
jgi:hypothetical protein